MARVFSRSQGKVIEVPDEQVSQPTAGVASGVGGDTQDLSNKFQQATLLDLFTTGGKNVNKLQTIQEIFEPSKEEREEQKEQELKVGKASGLANQISNLERSRKEVGAKGPILGLLPEGIARFADPESIEFESTKNTAAFQFAEVLAGQTGRALSDVDREIFMNTLPKKTDTDIGAQEAYKASFNTLASRLMMEGVSPERAKKIVSSARKDFQEETGIDFDEDDGMQAIKAQQKINEKEPNDPVRKMASIANSVGSFFFPETVDLLEKSLKEEIDVRGPSALEAIMGPGSLLARKDDVGEAVREIALAGVVDLATAQLGSKVGGPLIRKIGKSQIAENVYKGGFTIPRRMAQRVKPLQVAKELIEDGISGSLDELAEISSRVTGRDGAISKITREVAGRLPEPISGIDETFEAINEFGRTRAGALTSKQVKDTTKKIINIVSPRQGKKINTMSTLDGLDVVRQLENQGYELMTKGADFFGRVPLKNEQKGRMYLEAADVLKNKLDNVAKGSEALAGAKRQFMNEVAEISPNLADKVSKAKNFQELRRIASPYVRLGQITKATKDYGNTVFQQTIGTTGKFLRRAGAGAGGFAVGGPVGGLLLGGAEAGLRTATGATAAGRGAAKLGQSELLKSILGGGARAGAQSIRALFGGQQE